VFKNFNVADIMKAIEDGCTREDLQAIIRRLSKISVHDDFHDAEKAMALLLRFFSLVVKPTIAAGLGEAKPMADVDVEEEDVGEVEKLLKDKGAVIQSEQN
jgi:hypothetical protein